MIWLFHQPDCMQPNDSSRLLPVSYTRHINRSLTQGNELVNVTLVFSVGHSAHQDTVIMRATRDKGWPLALISRVLNQPKGVRATAKPLSLNASSIMLKT